VARHGLDEQGLVLEGCPVLVTTVMSRMSLGPPSIISNWYLCQRAGLKHVSYLIVSKSILSGDILHSHFYTFMMRRSRKLDLCYCSLSCECPVETEFLFVRILHTRYNCRKSPLH
jgi:hypothetical protein